MGQKMNSAKDLYTDLKAIQCTSCGVFHAIPTAMYDHKLDYGGYWYCPNGHRIGYGEGNLSKQLQKEKTRRQWAEDNAARSRKQADQSERRRIAQKAARTRLKNRVSAGVCPCCNRTFKQLAAHMKNKHPEYKHED